MKRHNRETYYVLGEGIIGGGEYGQPVVARPSTTQALRRFRFSRIGAEGTAPSEALRKELAEAMTAAGRQPDSSNPTIPAGFTYLGQFVDHDLTKDRTDAALGDDVTVAELVQGRSPALDLDSVYGRGPVVEPEFYSDSVHLKMGTTGATGFPDAGTNVDMVGFDLPRVGGEGSLSAQRAPQIPDDRNDENLAIAQTHLALIRFHNRVVDTLAAAESAGPLYPTARESVVKHYQWMLRHDYLPRIVDPAVVDDVYTNGRRIFEVPAATGATYHANPYMSLLPGDRPTMAIEFSVAAFRLGHSMIRGAYQWNRVFNSAGPGGIATLDLLFRFSGTSGVLDVGGDMADPDSGVNTVLPTNWIADFTRLYDFAEAGRSDLVPAAGQSNDTKLLDTLLVDPLKNLPPGSFGGRGKPAPPPEQLNLAFRNLVRAGMVKLASGQQMADLAQQAGLPVTPLTADEILEGSGTGADLSRLGPDLRAELAANTPLWFYILREAELNQGRLTGVGGRIVAEVFHRAMECSGCSIVRDSAWRPSFGPDPETFRMVDLLLFAFEGRADLLNPLGQAAPVENGREAPSARPLSAPAMA